MSPPRPGGAPQPRTPPTTPPTTTAKPVGVADDADSSQFDAVTTADFEIVKVHRAADAKGKPPAGSGKGAPAHDDDEDHEETGELTHLQTGDFESVDPHGPERSGPHRKH